MENIKIDLTKSTGYLKPVHGITNGPLCNNGLWDGSPYYREIGIPYVRLHDTDGNRSCVHVDIHRIFPDFDKDPFDENNYLFLETDDYIKAILDVDAKIIYRLGESIEQNHILRRYARPPKDFVKWTEICIQIIKHYNQGWANGFHYDMKFWEIWNEPDLTGSMWDGGTDEQYFQLYEIASKKIKEFDFTLMVGGCTACDPTSDFIKRFIQYAHMHNSPIDFLSYHIYTSSLPTVKSVINNVRELLDTSGYTKALTVMDEWNYFGSEDVAYGELWDKVRSADGAKETAKLCHEQQGVLGASYVCANFIIMNENPLDIATYYDGQYFIKFSGLFDPYGNITKTYHAFRAYGKMYKETKETVLCKCDIDGIYCISSKKDDTSYILISNFSGDCDYYTVEINGLEGETQAELYLVNDEFDLDLYKTEFYSGTAVRQKVWLNKNSVALMKLKKI